MNLVTKLWRNLNTKISWLALNAALFSGEKSWDQINALTYPRRLSQEQNIRLGIHWLLHYLALLKAWVARLILWTQNPLGSVSKEGFSSGRKVFSLSLKGLFFTWWEARMGDPHHQRPHSHGSKHTLGRSWAHSRKAGIEILRVVLKTVGAPDVMGAPLLEKVVESVPGTACAVWTTDRNNR